MSQSKLSTAQRAVVVLLGLCGLALIVVGVPSFDATIPSPFIKQAYLPIGLAQLSAAILLPFKRRLGAKLGRVATLIVGGMLAAGILTGGAQFWPNAVFVVTFGLLSTAIDECFQPDKRPTAI